MFRTMADEKIDNDSNSGEDKNHIKYCDRPEWRDVEPLPQGDGPNPVVQIAYSENFQDVHDYFRAILHSDEMSDRSLELCSDVLKFNSANYTAWDYRRKCLLALQTDLNEELEYITNVIIANPKNYQVWQHRRWVVENLRDPSKELKFITDMLDEDAKNYHAWQLRQWVLKEFCMWKGELPFIELMLDQDPLNNSAWNQRYYVIEQTTGFTHDVQVEEVKFAQDAIKNEAGNESAWNYLRGVLQQETLHTFPGLVDWCYKMFDSGSRNCHLLGLMVDCIEEMLEENQYEPEDKTKINLVQKAIELCQGLANEHDVIRKAMWEYRYREFVTKYEQTDDMQ